MPDTNVAAELRAGLALLPNFTLSADVLAELRRAAPAWPKPEGDERPDIAIEEHLAPGPAGKVRFLLYRPTKAKGPLPLFLFIHGGGYVLGRVEDSHPACIRTADEVQCLVASVDYRLAPETHAPGQVEDCHAVLQALHAEADKWGIDRSRIAIGGESAGGGIAAALALYVRDRGHIPIAFQQLIYPMLDDRTCTRDIPAHIGQHVWNRASNRFGWEALLGVAPGSAGVSPYAAAARAENLAGLPPAYISVGALDLFLPENLTYANRLLLAGVPVELHVYPGAYHGFEVNTAAPIAEEAQIERRRALAYAFGAHAFGAPAFQKG